MSRKRYPKEFKVEAVKQVTVAGHSVAEVASRLGMTTHSLYAWIKRYGPDSEQYQLAISYCIDAIILHAKRLCWNTNDHNSLSM